MNSINDFPNNLTVGDLYYDFPDNPTYGDLYYNQGIIFVYLGNWVKVDTPAPVLDDVDGYPAMQELLAEKEEIEKKIEVVRILLKRNQNDTRD